MVQIKKLQDKLEYESFLQDAEQDIKECMDHAVSKPENHEAYGVYEDELIGVFSFLLIKEEKYMEMTACYSEHQNAYQAMFDILKKQYSGYTIDFAFNTKNVLLKEQLIHENVELEPESQKMILENPQIDAEVDTSFIVPITKEYKAQYIEIYDKDGYWTGEKILQEKEKFQVFVAVKDEKVVGYANFTTFLKPNEPWGIYVLEEYRRNGIAEHC